MTEYNYSSPGEKNHHENVTNMQLLNEKKATNVLHENELEQKRKEILELQNFLQIQEKERYDLENRIKTIYEQYLSYKEIKDEEVQWYSDNVENLKSELEIYQRKMKEIEEEKEKHLYQQKQKEYEGEEEDEKDRVHEHRKNHDTLGLGSPLIDVYNHDNNHDKNNNNTVKNDNLHDLLIELEEFRQRDEEIKYYVLNVQKKEREIIEENEKLHQQVKYYQLNHKTYVQDFEEKLATIETEFETKLNQVKELHQYIKKLEKENKDKDLHNCELQETIKSLKEAAYRERKERSLWAKARYEVFSKFVEEENQLEAQMKENKLRLQQSSLEEVPENVTVAERFSVKTRDMNDRKKNKKTTSIRTSFKEQTYKARKGITKSVSSRKFRAF